MDGNLADRARLALLQPDWADAIAALARAAVETGLCDSAGVARVVDDDGFRTTGCTDLLVHEVGELQYQYGQGPGVEAMARPGVVQCTDVATDPRWPIWGPEAGRRGIGGVVTVHLTGAAHGLGALTLYSNGARQYGTDDLEAAELIGAHVSIALAHFHDTEHLWRAIDARHRIGQAQGILMERFDITGDAAFSLLRRLSQERHIKLQLIADHLVRTRRLPTTSDLEPSASTAHRADRSPDLALPRAN